MKVLVGIDFSDSTEIVLKEVEKIAKDSKVWIVHVVDPEPDFVGLDVGPKSVRDSWAKEFREEHCQIQEMADKLCQAGLDAMPLLLQGPTAQTILSEASKLDVDMIVVGSHGYGAVHSLILGSASHEILHKSKRPVLIVPTHKGD